MRKLIKQLSATTLALLLLSNNFNYEVLATNYDSEINTIEDENTTKPVLPSVNTNFGVLSKNTYSLNETNVEALMVTASVSDGGTISYQWYKNGVAITGETTSSYTPETKSSGTSTYYCKVINTINDVETTAQSDSVNITILEGSGSNNDSSVDTPTISEHYASYINYELNRPANELTLQINASRIESDGLSYKWYKSSANNTGSGVVIQSGTMRPYSMATISVTPETNSLGTYYYYCVVTNTVNGQSNSITSNVIKVTVSDHYDNNNNYNPNHPNNPNYDNNYNYNSQIPQNGYVSLGSNSNYNISSTSLENYLTHGGNNITISGYNIKSVRVPSTNYNTTPYYINIKDSYSGLNYSWKINDGTKVSSYLDLVVNTATSLSNVNKSYTNLNYDPHFSQVIKFNHEGSLNTNGATMSLQVPTTVNNGTVWLYKLSGKSIIANTERQANVSNGILYANMQSCSDWVVSANKLIDVTTDNVGGNDYYYNIKTDARLNIPQFQNVVIGGYVNLSTINTNFFDNYRFEGWYYDTAFQYPITGVFLTNLLITGDLISNGIYPKLTYYNTYVPENTFPVPSTSIGSLAKLF